MLLRRFLLPRFAFLWMRLYGVDFLRVPFLGFIRGRVLRVLVSSVFLWAHHMPCKPLHSTPLRS